MASSRAVSRGRTHLSEASMAAAAHTDWSCNPYAILLLSGFAGSTATMPLMMFESLAIVKGVVAAVGPSVDEASLERQKRTLSWSITLASATTTFAGAAVAAAIGKRLCVTKEDAEFVFRLRSGITGAVGGLGILGMTLGQRYATAIQETICLAGAGLGLYVGYTYGDDAATQVLSVVWPGFKSRATW